MVSFSLGEKVYNLKFPIKFMHVKLHLHANAVFVMPRTLRMRFLKEKEARRLLTDFSQRVGVEAEGLFGSKPRVEVTETSDMEIFIINGKALLAKSKNVLFPTLVFDGLFPLLPRVVVDMGAVPHICKGADIMAPGVVQVKGSFKEGDFLLIVDERHGKSLAIGVALHNSETMKGLNRGKVAKNIHYVGDGLWNFLKQI